MGFILDILDWFGHGKKPKTTKCAFCEKELQLVFNDFSARKIHKALWDKGTAFNFTANYGSEFDGNTYAMAICDECIKRKENDGLIVLMDSIWEFEK